MTTNDGGPAFPDKFSRGLSLRDYFAGCVLTGYVADGLRVTAALASQCYEDADVMLADRAKRLVKTPVSDTESEIHKLDQEL